jgi:hypothetical protein
METITPEVAIAQFEGHLKKAEIVPEVDITHLYTLAAKAKALVNIDITDNTIMKEVATIRKELVTERRKIQSDGLAARDGYNKARTAIKQVEDVLISIISEDEERLKEYERQRKEMDIREERSATLPQRKLLLKGIGDNVEISDDEILLMDDATFLNYVTERQTAKMEADTFAEQARLAEEERKAGEAQRIKDAEENARAEAEQRVKAEQEAEQARIKAEAEAKHQAEMKAKQDEIDRIRREQDEADRKAQEAMDAEIARQKAEAEEKVRLESEKEFQNWLTENGYNSDTDKIEDEGLEVVIYRKVAVYSKEI